MATKSYTTKKPTGLSIRRNGSTFVITWKIGDSNYGKGQTFQYKINNGKWKKSEIGVRSVKKVLNDEVDPSKFYPSTKTKLNSISVRVRGKRNQWSETVHDRKTGKDKTTTYKPVVSGWAEKTYSFKLPKKPTLTATFSDTYNNRTTFAWSTENKNDAQEWYRGVQCQTCFLKDNSITDGSKIADKYWSASSGSGATGSINIDEDTSKVNISATFTRWFRIRSRGPKGNSAWAYAKHIYAVPFKTTSLRASAKAKSNGYTLTASWTTPRNVTHPVDKINVQYVFATPESGLNCPSGASWQDAMTVAYKDGSDAASFSIDDTVGLDQCLYVRVNTVHDRNTTLGNYVRVVTGSLSAPTNVSITADISTRHVIVNATNNSAMGSSFLQIIYYSTKYPKGLTVGIIPHGQSSREVVCPAWADAATVRIGVRAVVGSATATARGDGVTSYAVTANTSSSIVYASDYGGSVPKAPTNVTLETTAIDGTIHVTFDCPWTRATGAELSWSDHPDAWQSTDEPRTYTLSDAHVSGWNISGLDTTKVWYVRVRLFEEANDTITYSAYSSRKSIDLSAVPLPPDIVLSKNIITERGSVTVSWQYVATDGSKQAAAELAEVSIVGNTTTYKKLTSVKTAQRIVLKASAYDWDEGETHLLAVRTTSTTGKRSEWSNVASVSIANPLTCTITQTSLVEQTIVDEEVSRTVMSLTEMPLTVTITGAGIGGTTRLIIERAETYQLERPDERQYNGFEGETIVSYTQTGAAQITIDNDDLVGHLDDGAAYRIIATVQDGLGQYAEATQDFEVHWTHQAIIPSATVEIDDTEMIAKLTPVAPEGAVNTDVCDIYRLSVDRPELIYPDAVFGTTYVDPYPTIGEYGGHRFVFRTANGDYITEDNELAWTDTRAAEGDWLETDYCIIDFGSGRVLLQYNIDLSNSWSKDFQETQYLGGSVQGDWNPAVSRTGTLSSVSIATDDSETIESMRRLAVYAGICHVRTKDGSSYPADVQVAESYSQDTAHKIVAFDLTITRVDAEDYDGMTLAEWQETEGE